MKQLLEGVLLAGCAGAIAVGMMIDCRPGPGPGPTPPGPPDSQAEIIWDELVEAGCVAPDDAGVQAVAQEYAEYGDAEAWIACMWAGGGVSSCQAPCGQAGKAMKIKR